MDGTATVSVPAATPGFPFQLPDTTQKMRGIAVQNNSDATITLAFGTLVPTPQIDVSVPPNTYQSIPLASIGALWINVGGGTQGQVYFHGTTDLVNAFTTQVVTFNLAGVAFSATPPVSLVIGGTPSNPTYTYGLVTPLAVAYGGTGSASGAWNCTSLGVGSTFINAVTNDMYLATSPGTTAGTLHFRTNGYSNADTGSIGAAGAFFPGPLNIGQGAIATVAGDANVGRSATQGAIGLGGASNRGVLDYNITSPNFFTFNQTIATTGDVRANGVIRTVCNVASNCLYAQPSADGSVAVLNVTNAAGSKSLLRVDSTDANNSAVYAQRGGNLASLVQCQTAAGAGQPTSFRMYYGTTAGTGSTVSVALPQAFSSTTSFMALIFLSATTIVASIVDASHFSFPTTSGQTYNWIVFGT